MFVRGRSREVPVSHDFLQNSKDSRAQDVTDSERQAHLQYLGKDFHHSPKHNKFYSNPVVRPRIIFP